MIIQSDQMRMGASRNYASSRVSYARQDAWNASGGTIFSLSDTDAQFQYVRSKSRNGNLAESSEALGDSEEEKSFDKKGLSSDPGAKDMKHLIEQMNAVSGVRRSSLQDSVSNFQKLKQQALNYLIDMLFGRRSRSSALSATTDTTGTYSELSDSVNSELYGAGGSYYSFFYYSEHETTCFDAQGTAVTADGREIPFNINLEMSRSFTQMAEHAIDFGKPRLCDPLVINLSGNACDVTDQKFLFDIDADGEEESISALGAGSAYLALDANSDGRINDGSELFGTASGNGFADLAAYDADGNGWIDEADEIFTKLKVWTKDENGNDQLLSLSDVGVGAIYLGYENTDFSLNRLEDNETNAVIRKSGIFLYENGEAGTVQQLDLAT